MAFRPHQRIQDANAFSPNKVTIRFQGLGLGHCLQAPNQPGSATQTQEAGLARGCAASSRATWLRCGALCPGSLTSPPVFLSPSSIHSSPSQPVLPSSLHTQMVCKWPLAPFTHPGLAWSWQPNACLGNPQMEYYHPPLCQSLGCRQGSAWEGKGRPLGLKQKCSPLNALPDQTGVCRRDWKWLGEGLLAVP